MPDNNEEVPVPRGFLTGENDTTVGGVANPEEAVGEKDPLPGRKNKVLCQLRHGPAPRI